MLIYLFILITLLTMFLLSPCAGGQSPPFIRHAHCIIQAGSMRYFAFGI